MLSKDESIFACFPEDLKSIIARKEVSSFVESDGEYAVTYDSLWLFSDREVYGSKTHPEEGEQYERNVLMSQNAAKYGGYTMYREDGSEAWAWFRSTAALAEVLNCHIFGGGHWVNGSHFNSFALTPGFCIA